MNYSQLGLVVVAAVAINLPFGAWRTTVRKYSLSWFLAIHLPIPAIFIIRRAAGFGWDFVPVMIACAAAGQLLGGWLYVRFRRARPDGEIALHPLPIDGVAAPEPGVEARCGLADTPAD